MYLNIYNCALGAVIHLIEKDSDLISIQISAMQRITLYFLTIAVCFTAWTLSQDEDNFGDEIAVVEKRIDVKEIIHFKKRRHHGAAVADWSEDETLYFQNKVKNRNGLLSLLSGLKVTDEPGHAKVCYPPGADVNVTWMPKVLSTQGSLTVGVSAIAPCNFMTGNLNINIYFAGVVDPIMTLEQPVSCSEVSKMIPCPIKKGVPIKFQMTRPFTNLPSGSFRLEANLTDGSTRCLCLEASVVVS